MNLKDVLVVLDASPASEARLRLAMCVARDHGASLSAVFGFDDQADNVPSGVVVLRHGLAAQILRNMPDIPQSAIFSDTVEQQLRECHHAFGGDGEWHTLDRTDSTKLIVLARAADLIIVGQINPHARPKPAWRAEDIVVACGRPVLMVPYVGTFTQVGRRVLVAWDGSREAARALNDALPVIGAAHVVTVMTVRVRDRDLERDRETTERIVRHLARHGIPARAEQRLRRDIGISDILLSRAMDLVVDLIVAGADCHSPLRETLVGSVSRGLFQRMTVPVLMSN
jgi:nucleotide-binding universal stress UspA family protein